MIDLLKKWISNRQKLCGSTRSNRWPDVRSSFLKIQPVCQLCGGSRDLNVHHLQPFHLHPELELDLTNLITLCESGKGGVNCHLHFGHLGNFKSVNINCVSDVKLWHDKIKNRP